MKKVLVFLMLLSATSVFSQDVIVKKDGSTILSKVLEVNTADIKYKKFSNQDGPTYTIDMLEVMSINYENGDKDTFGSQEATNATNVNPTNHRKIEKSAGSNNTKLIDLYNQSYNPTDKVHSKNSKASYYLVVFGLKSNSIMSNEDIEMKFVRDIVERRNNKHVVYYINLTNKTNHTIYIDRGNCFKLFHNGEFLCYYDNSEQMTVNKGGGGGASLGLGSVAGVLGIGGAVGQLANGVSIGGGSTHSVSTTYSKQRVIAIPPHGNRNLTEEKWVDVKRGSSKLIEEAESFNFELFDPLSACFSDGLVLEKGLVNKGQTLTFDEKETPWTREYIVTYSTDENFSTYSSINAEVFLHEIIGCQVLPAPTLSLEKYIDGLNQYTIAGGCDAR